MSKNNNINFNNFDLSQVKMPLECRTILEILPQKFPLLLVDRVESVNMDEIVAIKANTIGEHSLDGHFVGNPVVPGVNMIEACAQVCTLIAYFREHHPLDKTKVKFAVRMVKLDNVSLKKEVLPGDVLRITASHVSKYTAGNSVFHKFKAIGRVDGQIAIVATMTGYFFNDYERKY